MRLSAILPAVVAAVSLLAACQSTRQGADPTPAPAEAGALYFRSPQEAVGRATELLRQEDWATLARYYDLTDAPLDHTALASGDYFLREERPPGHHPGLPWRYAHPFTPGMHFEEAQPTARPGVLRVRVGIEIDQGGGPPQRGFETFLLRESERGYQLLPEDDASSGAPPADHTPASESADVRLLRPHLGDSVAALPPASRAALPALLAQFTALQTGAEPQLPQRAARPAPRVPGVDVYSPTDRELLLSETGRRIELVLETEPVGEVAGILEREWSGPMHLRYGRIDIRCEDHAGTGRLYYALAPEPRRIDLPKAKTPH